MSPNGEGQHNIQTGGPPIEVQSTEGTSVAALEAKLEVQQGKIESQKDWIVLILALLAGGYVALVIDVLNDNALHTRLSDLNDGLVEMIGADRSYYRAELNRLTEDVRVVDGEIEKVQRVLNCLKTSLVQNYSKCFE